MIIAMDGLGNPRAIEKLLLKKLDTEYKVFNYYDEPAYQTNNMIVIGHSFGGETAINFAKKRSKFVKELILIDPRWSSRKLLSTFDIIFGAQDRNSFDVVEEDFKCTNFYQRSFLSLPGYKVKGATNTQLYGKRHISLPGHKTIIDYVKSLL